jgi:hypothetical protein
MAIFVTVLLGIVYFVPSVVAFIRNDPQGPALMIANFFLAWTVIGWVILLVLACRSIRREPPAGPPQWAAAGRYGDQL